MCSFSHNQWENDASSSTLRNYSQAVTVWQVVLELNAHKGHNAWYQPPNAIEKQSKSLSKIIVNIATPI